MVPFLEILLSALVVQEIVLVVTICVCLRQDSRWRQTVKDASYQPQRLAGVESDVSALQAEIIAIRDEIAI